MRRTDSLGALVALLAQRGPGGARGVVRADDWVGILRLANAHLLGPALHDAVSSSPMSGASMPEDVSDYLRLLRHLNAERNTVLRRQCLEIVDSFSRQGIEFLFLKGAASLFAGTGSARDTRMMRDIDILVRPAAAEQALDALALLGYQVLGRSPDGDHAIAELARPGDAGAVDLHTELIDARYLLPAGDVFSRSAWCGADGRRFRLPSPEDELLHHLLHAQIHGAAQFYRGQVRLNQLYNFREIAANRGGQVDWQLIVHILDAHCLVAPLHSYLLLADRLFGMPWPVAGRPGMEGRLHAARVLLQLRFPVLGRIMLPLGNLQRAFASHRMGAIYGPSGSTFTKRLRHLCQYVQKKTPSQAFGQLFRFE